MPVNTEVVKIALCQLRTELVLEETLDKAGRMVREAAQSGARIVVLPEMFSCPYSGRYFHSFAARGHGPILEKLSAWAEENGVLLVGGSIPETEDGRLYNSAFVFGPDGRQLARHRKVHLFDVDIPGMRFKESDTFGRGNEITVFDSPFGRFGLAVCFDLRVPELVRAMAERGARAIFLPAQFNLKTGPMAWELLLRARVDPETARPGGEPEARSADYYAKRPCPLLAWRAATLLDEMLGEGGARETAGN